MSNVFFTNYKLFLWINLSSVKKKKFMNKLKDISSEVHASTVWFTSDT